MKISAKIKDDIALLLSGIACAAIAGATLSHVPYMLDLMVTISFVSFLVDNWRLRNQVRGLLADRARRDQRDKHDYLRRIALGLAAERDKRSDGRQP